MTSASSSELDDVRMSAADCLDEYKLSCQLVGLESQPRDVAAGDNDLIVSVGMAGHAGVWRRSGANAFDEQARSGLLQDKVHEGMALCVEAAAAAGFPSDAFISGGSDNLARVWTTGGEELALLIGHTNPVSSVTFLRDGSIVTGSWDGTARVWTNLQCVSVLGGHEHGVEVLALPSGELVTASANKQIHVYAPDEQGTLTVRTRIETAHDAPVRRLVRHPLGFASCGNDGMINVWSNEGEKLLSIAAHVTGPTDSFCYGIGVLPDAGFVSCGEDSTVRVWDAQGNQRQIIKHPGAVRSVKVMPNSDIISTCNDGVVRVFTRDPERAASEDDQHGFEQHVTVTMAAQMQAIDASLFPGPEGLLVAGQKDGEFKMINEDGKVWVHQWVQAETKWNRIGEAMGRANANRQVVDGVEYDHVTDVEVNDDKSVKLGWNTDDDPEEVADNFCAMYVLPKYIRQQIVDHIKPMCDMQLVNERKAARAAAAEAASLKQVPCWLTGGFHLFATSKVEAMRSKLLEFQQQLAEDGDANALDESDQSTFGKLMASISETSKYHVASFSDAEADLMEKMLAWPPSKVLPVLDAYRVLMLHQDACRKLSARPSVRELLLQKMTHEESSHHALRLGIQALANWTSKRTRTPKERSQDGSAVPEEVEAMFSEALDACADATSSDKSAVVNAYVMFAHNVVCWLGKMRVAQSDLYLVVTSGLFDVLESWDSLKAETAFYALLAITSIGVASSSAKADILDGFGAALQALHQKAESSKAAPLRELASDIHKVFFRQQT